MAKYQKFDEVPVWQEASRLYERVLDLLEESNLPLTPNFRNQLDRAALSVLNNIAAGSERMGSSETLSLLGMALNSAVDVQSMMAVASQRPKLARFTEVLKAIRGLAESCARQLGAWMAAFTNPQRGSKRPAGGPEEGVDQPSAKGGGDHFQRKPGTYRQ